MPRNDNVFNCPYCGGEVLKDACACPHCGSDKETGWSSNTYLDGIDLPDDVAYDDIRRNEFGSDVNKQGRKARYRLLIMILTAAAVAVSIGCIIIMR